MQISKHVAVGTACAILGGGGIATAATNHSVNHAAHTNAKAHIVQGPQGPRGYRGFPGRNGLNGTNGTNGRDGQMGAQGPQGLEGDKGDKGDTGAQGQQGITVSVARVASWARTTASPATTWATPTAAQLPPWPASRRGHRHRRWRADDRPWRQERPGRIIVPRTHGLVQQLPMPNRLDGWIVQFASQDSKFTAPEQVKVYALCARAQRARHADLHAIQLGHTP